MLSDKNIENNQEFKMRDLNNMTNEEILWALKKVPRSQMDTHTKTLFIGAIESLKNKLKKETEGMTEEEMSTIERRNNGSKI